MRFSLLGVSLALAWFILVNVAASIVVAALARPVIRRSRPTDGRPRSAWPLLVLRMSPTLVALAFVSLVFAPAYARFEPREVTEPLGAGLAAMVIGALLVIGGTWWRGAAAWRRVGRLQRCWLQHAERLESRRAPIPIYQVDIPTPVVSLLGVRRQALFISRRVVETLTPGELDVVIAHELAHRGAWDNLVRLILLASPDCVSLTRTGSRIQGAWARAAEDAADRRAASGDRSRAVALSAALLKVARLALASPQLAGPVSSLDDGGPITERILRLALPDQGLDHATLPRRLLFGLAVGLIVVCLALPEPALQGVHRVSEFLVSLAI